MTPDAPRHFLTLDDRDPARLEQLIDRSLRLKQRAARPSLAGRVALLLFEHPSTRTRAALEVGMAKLGGQSVFMSASDTQLGRSESIADTARVLSRMADVVALRLHHHESLTTFAQHAWCPVVNALTDRAHPCQLLADMAVYREHRGAIRGRRVAWIGDANNVCASYIRAARLFDFELAIACPEGFEPAPQDLHSSVSVVRDPEQAVRGASLVATDTWVSMGDDASSRHDAFAPYCVTPELISQSLEHAVFLHCLPAYRGKEVATGVIEGPRSLVWEQAEYRLYTHQALFQDILESD